MPDNAHTCIVGAGISGLTAGKALAQTGVAYHCYERGSDIGGLWRYDNDSGTSSAYRSLHIDSSRQSIGYPDFPVPEHLPDYLSHAQVAGHFDRYAERFELRGPIRFRHDVTAVVRAGDGWDITVEALDGGETITRRYRHVILANGHLTHPKLPDFPGSFDGDVIHSHHYKVADPFEDKRVLVVGIGNSAVDIAVDIARRARSVMLSTRRSAWIMPKYISGIPIDRWLRFMTARLKMPVPMARGVLRHIAQLAIGDQRRFGVPRPAHPIWREHATLSQELLPYLGHGWIRMKPNIATLEGDTVAFVDGSREPVDAIIHATGYETRFPFLEPSLFRVDDGRPPALYRRIVHIDHPTLFFSGLVQPVGATIPLVEVQGRWIAGVITGRIALPDRAGMMAEIDEHRARVARRYLDSARYTLEVDARGYTTEMNADLAAG
ncbi:MAG: NAD(P)-binding domain-containing protein [Burkholderiaceae bacterium]